MRKTLTGRKSSISLTTRYKLVKSVEDNDADICRDCSGSITPGPSLSQITCQIEAVGGIKAGTLPRLIQVQESCNHIMIILSFSLLQVVPGESGEYDIVYSLPKEGIYRMWIRIYGKDIQDSPFQVNND